MCSVCHNKWPYSHKIFWMRSKQSTNCIQKEIGTTKQLGDTGPLTHWGHLPDDIFKCISLNENVWILIEISLKFVRKSTFNNIPALVPIMALSGPMMVILLMHICVIRPQWVDTDILFWISYCPLQMNLQYSYLLCIYKIQFNFATKLFCGTRKIYSE